MRSQRQRPGGGPRRLAAGRPPAPLTPPPTSGLPAASRSVGCGPGSGCGSRCAVPAGRPANHPEGISGISGTSAFAAGCVSDAADSSWAAGLRSGSQRRRSSRATSARTARWGDVVRVSRPRRCPLSLAAAVEWASQPITQHVDNAHRGPVVPCRRLAASPRPASPGVGRLAARLSRGLLRARRIVRRPLPFGCASTAFPLGRQRRLIPCGPSSGTHCRSTLTRPTRSHSSRPGTTPATLFTALSSTCHCPSIDLSQPFIDLPLPLSLPPIDRSLPLRSNAWRSFSASRRSGRRSTPNSRATRRSTHRCDPICELIRAMSCRGAQVA